MERQAALYGGNQRARWRIDQSVRDTTAARQREAVSRLGQWTTTNKGGGVPPPPNEVLAR